MNADIVKKAEKAGGAPAWLKDYAGQLEDPEYSALTLAERGLLKDLRLLALRRGNKIPNDEAYLRGQLRCSPRTRLAPKLHTLCTQGFLEAHPDAHELPANTTNGLEPRESEVSTDKNHYVDKKDLPRAVALDIALDAAKRPSEYDTFLKETTP